MDKSFPNPEPLELAPEGELLRLAELIRDLHYCLLLTLSSKVLGMHEASSLLPPRHKSLIIINWMIKFAHTAQSDSVL